jgi:hypothetical protein
MRDSKSIGDRLHPAANSATSEHTSNPSVPDTGRIRQAGLSQGLCVSKVVSILGKVKPDPSDTLVLDRNQLSFGLVGGWITIRFYPCLFDIQPEVGQVPFICRRMTVSVNHYRGERADNLLSLIAVILKQFPGIPHEINITTVEPRSAQ